MADPTPAEKIDPLVANLMKSFDNVLPPTSDTEIKPVSELAGMTLGEVNSTLQSKKATISNSSKVPTTEPESAAPVATPNPPATPAVVPASKPGVVKKKPLPETTPAPIQNTPSPAIVAAAVVGLSSEDAAYVKQLTPEQQDEIALAQFADVHGHAGKLAATLKYFKDLDRLIETSPELTPDSEDFIKFTKDNEPKWNASVRKKMEREMIIEEATAKVRSETQPVIREQQRQLQEVRMKQSVEEHVDDLVSKMTDTNTAQGEGGPAIDSEVVEYIREHGYDAAAKKFKVEAPIVMGSINAQRAWEGFSHGTIQYNPNDPTHNWLIGFLQGEGQRIRQLPAKERSQNGKEFLPLQEYAAEYARNPQEAQSKFYTFDDASVMELLARNAILSVNTQIKEFEESGFKYDRKTKKNTEPVVITPDPTPTQGSPGAGFRAMPGAAPLAAPQVDHRAAYFDKLIPGGAKIAGVA